MFRLSKDVCSRSGKWANFTESYFDVLIKMFFWGSPWQLCLYIHRWFDTLCGVTAVMLQNVDNLLHMGNISVMLGSPILEKRQKISELGEWNVKRETAILMAMGVGSCVDSSLISRSTIIFLLVCEKGIRRHAASLQNRRVFLGSHCFSFGCLLYVMKLYYYCWQHPLAEFCLLNSALEPTAHFLIFICSLWLTWIFVLWQWVVFLKHM